MKIYNTRTLLLYILSAFLLLVSTSAQLQAQSKEEMKFWRDKAKMYKKQPLTLKAEFENYQNQIKDLKKRNKELMQRGTTNSSTEALIDSLRWALIQSEGELRNQRKQLQKMEAAYASQKNVGEMGIKTGLVYRIQIGAYVFYEMKNPVEGQGFYTENADGFHKYVIGGFRTYEDAIAFRDEVRRMGLKDAWVVPYIDGVRSSLEEADQYLQRQAASYNAGNE